jgi:hypothetical protein
MKYNTRNNGLYKQGAYESLDALQETSLPSRMTQPRYFTSFIHELNDEISECLKFRKREPLEIKKKIKINKSVYNYLQQEYGLNCKFKIINDFFSTTDLLDKRFELDNSSIEIIKDTFKVKLLRKKSKTYYTKKLNNLIEKKTIEKYFFVYKFQKLEKTPYHNTNN